MAKLDWRIESPSTEQRKQLLGTWQRMIGAFGNALLSVATLRDAPGRGHDGVG
jgi:hypothetical protein